MLRLTEEVKQEISSQFTVPLAQAGTVVGEAGEHEPIDVDFTAEVTEQHTSAKTEVGTRV